jgi:phage terminase large subunit-like protein
MDSMTRGERNIAWIEEHLRVPEGRLVGQPVRLGVFQRLIILGIYDAPELVRRALISFARKNGKTALVAMLLLLHLCGPEARQNSQLYSAAQSKDQAAIVYKYAAQMVRMSPLLMDYVTEHESLKELRCPALGTLYKALSADAPTKFGLSPAFIVHDELGQVRGPKSELYDALETATGAQDNPLSLIISTQAATDGDLLSILIDDAASGEDPRSKLFMYAAPMDLDPFSEEAIRAANPGFDTIQNKAEVLAMAADAKRMPSKEPEYRNLVLNQRVESISPFISRQIWTDCAKPVVPEFSGEVYIGLDLSEINDLTAAVAVSLESTDSLWHVKPTCWLPEDGLAERSQRDRAPYDLWNQQGYLETCPGPTVSYEYVAEWLWERWKVWDVAAVGFDRWNMRHLEPWLRKAGFKDKHLEKFKAIGQGTQSMSPALRTLEGWILRRELAHGGHPVLTMCMANARVTSKDASNRKLDKKKSTGRIDAAVALVMAAAVAGEQIPAEPKKFNIRLI